MSSKRLVVDTSVIVKWINAQDEQDLPQADKLLKEAQTGKVVIIVPELAKYETGNAILNKHMDLLMGQTALETIFALPITFMPLNETQAQQTLEIAQTGKITYYDASFISLAINQKTELITANPKHQKGIPGVRVIILKNYH